MRLFGARARSVNSLHYQCENLNVKHFRISLVHGVQKRSSKQGSHVGPTLSTATFE
jgi:hypothetical protein